MNTKDQFFILYRGDDSNFTGNQEIIIELQTTLDLTGCKAHFKFLDFQQDFNPIPADKKLHLVFPKASTARFPVGAMDAELWLEDTNQKRRTVANRIHIVITQSISEAYDSSDPQAITVVIGGGYVDWKNVTKPLTTANVFNMECSDWQFRKVVARLWTELGGKVENND